MFRIARGFAAPRILLLALLILPGLSGIAAAQSGYRLKAGDVLQIEVLEDPSLNRSTLVLPDGSVNFPQVGTIAAGGRTVDQVRAALTQALAPGFASQPNVYVSVASLAPATAPAATAPGAPAADTIRVYVMGEVGSPGARDIAPDSNLLQFLAQAGTLSRFAARNRIELHRVDAASRSSRVYLFDLDNVAGGPGLISGMTQVGAGDVIVVPTRRLFE